MLLWFACGTALSLKPSPWLSQKARQQLGWLPAACHKPALGGFTLAELLICVAILGVIATFTIPKIITYSTNKTFNANTNEVAGALTAAIQRYQQEQGIVAGVTKGSDLFQYMNYINYTTSSSIKLDSYPNIATTWSCSVAQPCIRLANGSLLYDFYATGINNTTGTGPLVLLYDPDGVISNNNDSVLLLIFPNGMVRTRSTIPSGTIMPNGITYGAIPNNDPTWLSWTW